MMQGTCEALDIVIPWAQIADSSDKWIVFTSVQGIRAFFQKCREDRIDNRCFASCKFAVIGAATKRELEAQRFLADVCPQEYTSAALADTLLSQIREGERVYLFCSRQGTDVLVKRLRENQVECRRFDLYDTHFSCVNLDSGPLEYILFGSAGGVRALQQSGYRMGKGARGICIGPVCAEAFRECFQKEPIVAREADVEALTESLLNIVAGNERNKQQEKEVENI